MKETIMASYANNFRSGIGPVSWSAVIAGAVVAIIAQFLLNLLGLAIGAANVPEPMTADADDGAAAGTMALAWWSMSGVVAAAVGGLTAGLLAKQSGRANPMCHGLLAWAVGSLVVVATLAAGGATMSAAAGPFGAQLADYEYARGEVMRAEFQPAATGPATGAPGIAVPDVSPAATERDMQTRMETAGDALSAGALTSLVALLIGAIASSAAAMFASKRASPGAYLTARDDLELIPAAGSAGPGAPKTGDYQPHSPPH
jgi:hypothetical protein